MTFLQKMHDETISESRWEKEPFRKGSNFIHTVQKGKKGVPKLKDVKAVLAVHRADLEFINYHVMPLNADNQDIIHQDAFAAAEAKMPLKRGLSVEDRFIAVAVREKAAVNYIAQTYYDVVVDFESPWNSAYNLKPQVATIFLKVSTHNQMVKGFLKGKLFDDICSLLAYDSAHAPLGSWGDESDGVTLGNRNDFLYRTLEIGASNALTIDALDNSLSIIKCISCSRDILFQTTSFVFLVEVPADCE